MKLSTKGKYGVKAMVELALNYGNTPISIKTISKRQNISEYYLEQLFASLRKAKLVKSMRGAQGGYVLTREPKDITVQDVMNVVEGPVKISSCIDDETCKNIDGCATRLLWEKLKKSIDEVMASVSLQDIVDDYKNIQKNNEIIKLVD